jgi:hypothetical protein
VKKGRPAGFTSNIKPSCDKCNSILTTDEARMQDNMCWFCYWNKKNKHLWTEVMV